MSASDDCSGGALNANWMHSLGGDEVGMNGQGFISGKSEPMKCPHCQSGLDQVKGKPRSLEQLRRFFGVLHAMYAHWPESAEFQPHSEEHLRGWVLCMAGHRVVVKTLIMPRTSNPALMASMMQFAETLLEMDNRFGRWKGSTLAVYEAKSIAFHKLGQAEFNKLNDDVEAVYKAETGLDPDEVLKQNERAA